MTTSIATAPPPYTTLDARITRALLALRQARLAAAHSPNGRTLQMQTRAEEELNALLDYRSAVGRRASTPQAWRRPEGALRLDWAPWPPSWNHPGRVST